MRAVALLRGVNVGGVRFAMTDLAAALTADGCTGVRTVLASGNVLLDRGDERLSDVAARVSRVVLDRFGFDVAVIAVDLATVRAAVDGYPFERVGDRHAYVVLAEGPAALDGLLPPREAPAFEEEERLVRGDGVLSDAVLYWDVPKGRTLGTVFGKRLGQRQRAGTVTTRNLNTLERILAAGRAVSP